MDIDALITEARKSLTAERVFGAPYEKDGVVVLPVASIRGGGGGGGGPTGGGGGGVEARPAGAFVIQNGAVRWQPAVDPNRLILLAAVALFTVRSLLKARARRKWKLRKAAARA